MICPLFSCRLGIAVLAFGFNCCVLAQGSDLAQADYLLRQGESARALESVERFLAERPKDARGRFLKGVILAEQKKPQEAIKVYTDLTHEYPDVAEPYNNLAVLHAAQGEYDKARTALEMAIRVKPDYAVAHENLGDIYARMAAQAYDKAAQIDRGNKTAPVKLKQATELLSGSRR
jgi:tetratricopeptide (TPR) repeat protein